MKIVFKEDRTLLTGAKVKAGKTYDFLKENAEAFIANGVAVKAKEKPEPKETKET